MSELRRPRATSAAIGLATAIALVGVSIVPFLSPAWVAFEQDRSQAAAWTGFAPADLRAATNAILADLVLGPPDFDVTVAGSPVLNERERSHMADVRQAFLGLWTVTALAIAVVVIGGLVSRRSAAWWQGVRAGAIGLALGAVGVGLVAAVAFDPVFELLHRLLFAGGSWTFDPRTDRLVQLFPYAFWYETSLVLGATILAVSVAVALAAGRRTGRAPRPSTAGRAVSAEVRP